MREAKTPAIADYLAVGTVSAALLAFEILLLRLFCYSQWHHFASIAIALALLGFGAAGTFLALLGPRAVGLGDRLFVTGMLIGAGGITASFLLPYLIIVRPLFAVWDLGELSKLILLDFVAFIPFFGMALCIGQVFMRWPESIPRLYAVNLVGSGFGSVAAAVLLSVMHLEYALLTILLALLMTAAGFGLFQGREKKLGVICSLGAVLCCIWLSAGVTRLPLSDFKQLAYLLDLPDARIIERRSGLQTDMTLIESDSIRISPGLSLHWTKTVPSQDALVLGSDKVLPLLRERNPVNVPAHLRATLGALPFQLRPNGPVAILGAGDWQASILAIPQLRTWVEENPHVIRLYTERGLLEGANIHASDPRGFLASSDEQFNHIFLGSVAMGGDATSEDYLLSVESIVLAMSKLHSQGILAIPLKLHHPPRYAVKLMSLVKKALIKHGADKPWQHLVMLRGMREAILLVATDPITANDIRMVRGFAAQWGFDLVALPGMTSREANRYHLLDTPVFYQSARAIFHGEAIIPSAAFWYALEPPTDAQPYFWKSMRWNRVPSLLKQFGRQGLIWLDWGLLATVAKLIAAAALAGLLILLPLGQLPKGEKPLTRPWVCLYFASLGLGFLVLELAVFQRSILFLVNPVVAAALVFAVFLIGAGLGSFKTPETNSVDSVRSIFLPIIGFSGLAYVLMYWGLDLLSGRPLWVRLVGVAIAIAPLSWSLGRAMPWGLRQLHLNQRLIPWAWGINGFASVLAAPLAVLLSIHFGQTASWLVGGLCYLVAWSMGRRFSSRLGSPS